MTLYALALVAFLIAALLILGWLKKRKDARLADELDELQPRRPDGIDEDWERNQFGQGPKGPDIDYTAEQAALDKQRHDHTGGSTH